MYNIKLYSVIHSFFECISCKTLPDDFDPAYDCSDEETEEIQEWPYDFFMIR
jgi:hypothetical protein